MRLTFSLGHLRLDLSLCEPEDDCDDCGQNVETTASTEIAPEPPPFGFAPDDE